jgi:hypothetical protein
VSGFVYLDEGETLSSGLEFSYKRGAGSLFSEQHHQNERKKGTRYLHTENERECPWATKIIPAAAKICTPELYLEVHTLDQRLNAILLSRNKSK